MAMTSPRPTGTMGAGTVSRGANGPDMLLPGPATRASMTRTATMSAVDMAIGVPGPATAAQFATRRDRTGMVARLADTLEQWRERIDGLLRRSDLGEVALRDALGDRLAHLEVALEVAHQRLWVSASTVGHDADSIYNDVEDALAEVKVAYAEVVAILGRR